MGATVLHGTSRESAVEVQRKTTKHPAPLMACAQKTATKPKRRRATRGRSCAVVQLGKKATKPKTTTKSIQQSSRPCASVLRRARLPVQCASHRARAAQPPPPSCVLPCIPAASSATLRHPRHVQCRVCRGGATAQPACLPNDLV